MKTFICRGAIAPLSFLLFFLLSSISYADSAFTIIRPAMKTVMDEAFTSVVVKPTEAGITKIGVTDAMGNETFETVVPKRNVYCRAVKLQLGQNKLTVTAYRGDDKIDTRNVSVYFRSEIFAGFQEEPSGYKKSPFHADKDEQICKTCHDMNEKFPQNGEIPDNPEDSTCFQCHKGLLAQGKGHAPAINWMCNVCHNGKNGEYDEAGGGKSRYSAPNPIMDVCFNCHKNIKEIWFAKKSEHGPVRDGRCNRCHNPHSSPELFFMRKPIWELCTTCHSEKATGAHVISSFVRDKAHPMKGKPDPARPGRELVCSGCHDPHGSEGIFLLRSKGKTAFSVCVRCHQK